MDNFLSGREQLGDQPKPKEEETLLPEGALEKLQLPENEGECQVEESEGESGSRVAYVTEEGRVTKIVVTCSCGQVTEIDCAYEG